jgi:hypothetical protein
MKYLKALGFNFLVIFFANYILPGIKVEHATKIPSLGVDFPFALVLGFLNTMIYPLVCMFKGASPQLQIVAIAAVLNLVTYGIASLFPLGIGIESLGAYLLVVIVVTIASVVANFSEMKKNKTTPPPSEPPPVI